MRVERVKGNVVRIVLSKRNLQVLLNKLNRPESFKTIYKDGVFVVAETDEVHYIDHEPGPMHPKDLPQP